jgi:LysR family cyn operon transcriptional activator
MELRHLRYFSVLAACEHFTRAAEKLFVTQSTLSHTIKQLEEELGMELFDRVGKRVALNKDGSQFLNTVARTLQELDSGIVNLRQSTSSLSGELRVGTIHTFNIRLTPHCIAAFLKDNPTVQVRVLEGPAQDAESRLLAGELDLCISYPPKDPNLFWYETLFNEELVLAVPPDHPFAARRRIRMVELHRQPLILPPPGFGARHLLDSCFRSVNIEPTVIAEVNSFYPCLEIGRRLKVPVLLSYTAAEGAPGVQIVRIEDPKPIRTPVLLWRKDTPQSSAARAFAEIVKQTVASYIDPMTREATVSS